MHPPRRMLRHMHREEGVLTRAVRTMRKEEDGLACKLDKMGSDVRQHLERRIDALTTQLSRVEKDVRSMLSHIEPRPTSRPPQPIRLTPCTPQAPTAAVGSRAAPTLPPV